MAAPPSATATDAPVEVTTDDALKTKSTMDDSSDVSDKEQATKEHFATNQKMVEKYHAMFPKVPSMTSRELVDRWRQIDKMLDERDDSDNGEEVTTTTDTADQPGPLLLIDARSKAERKVSMIQGALAMEDLEASEWMNRYVHNFYGVHKGGTPTIVFYCTVGFRSGREAQWLIDDLTSTYGIEIGKTVEVKNLDGLLAYSFVEDAPPLMRPCPKGSSDSFMTRRIHSYGKEWADAAHPSFEVVYFDSKPRKALQLVQTGLFSGVRMLQHAWSHSKTKAVATTNVVARKCVEPVVNMTGSSIFGNENQSDCLQSHGPNKRISKVGYTSNESTKDVPLGMCC